MTGTRAFLLDMGLPVIWLLILLAISAVIVRSKRRETSTVHVSKRRLTVRGAVAMIIVLFGVATSVFWMAKQIQCRSTLHNLTADSVASISIGNATLEKQEDLGLVIGALHGAKWYKPIASDGRMGEHSSRDPLEVG